MTPIIRRLYPDNAEKRREALERHLVYYNTENNFGAAIAGIAASMEEELAGGAEISSAAINSIKAALMGPLAGIGDTVTQSLVKTGLVASSIAVSMPLTITAGETSVVLQDVLNAVLRGMLPLIAFLLIYRLVNKGVKPVRIILIIFASGVIGSLLGILA